MDELLKALTEAIRTGTQLAYPAVIGYFVVRVFENVLIYPLTWGMILFGLGRLLDKIFSHVREFNAFNTRP